MQLIIPLLRKLRRFFSGFWLYWFGRYKKTPRVKAKKFIRGTMPSGSTSGAIDFAKQKTRTPYGIANCCCEITFTTRTYRDIYTVF